MTNGDTSQDLRYAPPQAHVEDVATPGDALLPARRIDRFWATMIDIGVAVVCLCLMDWFTPWHPWAEAESRDFWDPDILGSAIEFALFLAVNGIVLARRGQTLGKALLGLRIVRPDGSRAGLGRLLLARYGVIHALGILSVGQFFAFIDAAFIFRASRRCLHDQIANTIVVKA